MSLFLAALVAIPVGYGVRFATGITPEWFNNAVGNVAYESFWIFLVLAIWPKLRPPAIAIGVCCVTCALEFLQLSQDPALIAARRTLLGRLVLGTTFTWEDFPTYFLGSAIGGWLALRLRQQAQSLD
ncbi:DUF2809 domain-containing protein [Alkalinema sp. FACHB-956]|uniref:ribosomal maturation YjgA family protein n=1 Tax=Alkalinema sp. FACHB-956 TaxID=2692768 RepID=UPI001F556256|nr:DUF2809 domain-containing protein [Alkalinema sp. FACHB-956]